MPSAKRLETPVLLVLQVSEVRRESIVHVVLGEDQLHLGTVIPVRAQKLPHLIVHRVADTIYYVIEDA